MFKMAARKILFSMLATAILFAGAVAADRARAKTVEIIDARLRVVKMAERDYPCTVFLHAEFIASGDGLVRFRFREAGLEEAREYTARTKKFPDGTYRSRFERAFRIHGPVERRFMIEAVDQDVATGWQLMTVSCGI